MGRMHSHGKGMSASALPYKRTPPSWLKISPQEVNDNICKFAKKGLTPSQIGVILRDKDTLKCNSRGDNQGSPTSQNYIRDHL